MQISVDNDLFCMKSQRKSESRSNRIYIETVPIETEVLNSFGCLHPMQILQWNFKDGLKIYIPSA